MVQKKGYHSSDCQPIGILFNRHCSCLFWLLYRFLIFISITTIFRKLNWNEIKTYLQNGWAYLWILLLYCYYNFSMMKTCRLLTYPGEMNTILDCILKNDWDIFFWDLYRILALCWTLEIEEIFDESNIRISAHMWFRFLF